MTTAERLQIGIADVLAVDLVRMKPESVLCDDLGADSLDLVELTMWAEEEFDIEIPDERIDSSTTVEGMVKVVDEILARKCS